MFGRPLPTVRVGVWAADADGWERMTCDATQIEHLIAYCEGS